MASSIAFSYSMAYSFRLKKESRVSAHSLVVSLYAFQMVRFREIDS